MKQIVYKMAEKEDYPCREAIQVSQSEDDGPSSLSSGKWSKRLPQEGFFVTTDLSTQELEDVLRAEDKNKWDRYLTQNNIMEMTVISFSNCKLKKVPTTLCKLPCITRLYLANNDLSTLPTEFTHLKNLTNLNLQSNRFSEIPEALCKLRNLKILSLQRNNINNEGLKNIDQLSQLVELYLSSNRIKELPTSVCRLSYLTLLDLKCNLIEKLPDEIANLTKLRVLNARSNYVKRLPDNLGNLKHLKVACFAENCIESVKLGSFLRLTDLKDLCLYSNRLENKEDLEKYIGLFKSRGKLLRVAENRVTISHGVACDSPYEFNRHDVTFIHDGTEEVANWVQRAKSYLGNESISSTIKTPLDRSIDILNDVRCCHVVVPIFTKRFHEMVDKEDPAGENIRVGLREFDKHLGNFLVVFYGEDCNISSRWFKATISMTIRRDGGECKHEESNNGNCDNQFIELYDNIIGIRGDRMSVSSTYPWH